ncbi:MAG: hypothetical protein A6D92_13930 [Symbiobacterium thermophilum]|uniref:Uncharacterized protein n=1 Tax=Symbiobacterium thermophilum TaxID=2734 RepID=A0A1Y2T2Z7_SYMTR|nr:MAG: hypothetical protein A6D92_13930 [Symbiobacterium thermophilum]
MFRSSQSHGSSALEAIGTDDETGVLTMGRRRHRRRGDKAAEPSFNLLGRGRLVDLSMNGADQLIQTLDHPDLPMGSGAQGSPFWPVLLSGEVGTICHHHDVSPAIVDDQRGADDGAAQLEFSRLSPSLPGVIGPKPAVAGAKIQDTSLWAIGGTRLRCNEWAVWHPIERYFELRNRLTNRRSLRSRRLDFAKVQHPEVVACQMIEDAIHDYRLRGTFA